MRRRDFITLLGGGAAAWPLSASAQQQVMPVIGSLYAVSATEWAPYMAGFRRGLIDVGFIEGQNVTIEYRWAEGHLEKLPAGRSNRPQGQSHPRRWERSWCPSGNGCDPNHSDRVHDRG
jgi:hypothetical protein